LKFYNWYETRNHFWLIIEYCSGGDLYSLLEQDKKLPEHSIKKLAFELLEGLGYCHSQGIIFGDLKPSNIMINEYCHLKLCDFSLAKKVSDLSNYNNTAEERTSAATHASSKNKAGTPFYMAPELFQDNGVYSYYSDFWSLGCILMEMASGKPPFYSNSLKDLIQKITTEEIRPIEGFTVEFNDLLMKLLQKDPIYRINWDELKKHPFWSSPCNLKPATSVQDKQLQFAKYKFTKRLYQPQLHFDKYLKNVRKIDPTVYY
jgi:serine/threonine-protein kinase ULK4